MDEKPSLFQRTHAAIAYLGACLLLIESARALLSLLRACRWSARGGGISQGRVHSTSVAFLVDGENLALVGVERTVEHALSEATKLGEVNIKRVYGNCHLFNNNNNKWNDTCLHLDLEQIHITKPTTTKNTSDIALAVDAIELAVEGTCNRFCIVTSDSDFTPLVRRLRELKCQVMGIGEKKTPRTLTKACNWFVFADQLTDDPAPAPPPTRTQPFVYPSTGPLHRNPLEQPFTSRHPDATLDAQTEENVSQQVIRILTEAYRDAVHGKVGEWVLLSRLGLSLRQLHPDFKASAYAEDLSTLIRQHPTTFELGKRTNGHPQMRLRQE